MQKCNLIIPKGQQLQIKTHFLSFEIVIQSLTFLVSETLILMIVMWSIQLALIQLE